MSKTTLTDEEELKEAIKSLCKDGELKVGSYFEGRVGSLGNDTNLVHEQYVDTGEDETGDDPDTITVDPAGGDDGDGVDGSDGGDGGGLISDPPPGGGGESGGAGGQAGAAAVFNCPQCGNELKDTSCECGFEFDASSVTEGEVSVEGATTGELLERFGLEKPDTPNVRPHPPMGTIDADNKPDLIDKLEREIQGWEIHTAEITIKGALTSDELAEYGINASTLDNQVTLDETFEIEPDEPIKHDSFLGLMWDLNVPEKASLSVKMEVDKGE